MCAWWADSRVRARVTYYRGGRAGNVDRDENARLDALVERIDALLERVDALVDLVSERNAREPGEAPPSE